MKTLMEILFFILFIFLFHSISFSDEEKTLQVRAVRVDQSVTVDGILTEQFWKDEYGVSQFVQRDPVEGALPSEKTIVDIVYDNEAIYVGARMYDSESGKIMAQLGRKDVDLMADLFMLYLDPYHDRRTGFYFGVNAAGTLYDGTLLNDSWEDNSWDGVWEGKARIDERGWSVEMRIPYSQLRFQKKDQYVWGINFKRTIGRKNEHDFLVYTPKNGSGFVSRFPDLVGIENIQPRRRIEVLPYVTSKMSYTDYSTGDPFNDGSGYALGTGADVKIGLGTNLNLDATVNPDFGQVEVDPAVVNLTDVETFFVEKRPFFIEGSSIFDFGEGGASNYWGFNWSDPLLFYSRRIGRVPQGSVPDADYESVPVGTRILGAAKLSGKIGNGWNIGTLHAFTDREFADVASAGQESESEVEPPAYYEVTRGLKEFHEGRQGIGLITTLATRFFEDDRLRDEINSSSFLTGVDGWTFLDSNKAWVLTGYAAVSQIHGNEARITAVQENAQHYFQRPDADYLEVDPEATSLSGYLGRVYLNKQKGNLFFNSALGFISPKFDSNDLGFLWRADQINGHIGGGYKWTEPQKYYRFAEIGFAAFKTADFDWNTTWSGLFHFGYVEFPNYYTMDYSIAWNPERTINNTRTRGGPQTLNLPGFETNLFVATDKRKKWVFGVGENTYESGNSSSRFLQAQAEWKPRSNVSLSCNPQWERLTTPAFWIDAFDDPLADHTFGKRYVFGALKQTTFSSSLRLNWTFTPKLSLQLYGQPLISSGKYKDYKELARPASYDFHLYPSEFSSLSGDTFVIDPDGPGPANSISFDNPNFNFKSLRGNAILRWEYRPGTTVFFVWTQTRTDDENRGDFDFTGSLGRLWSAKADNIFLIKFSYYWNP